jgi:hypothetical protein
MAPPSPRPLPAANGEFAFGTLNGDLNVRYGSPKQSIAISMDRNGAWWDNVFVERL